MVDIKAFGHQLAGLTCCFVAVVTVATAENLDSGLLLLLQLSGGQDNSRGFPNSFRVSGCSCYIDIDNVHMACITACV